MISEVITPLISSSLSWGNSYTSMEPTWLIEQKLDCTVYKIIPIVESLTHVRVSSCQHKEFGEGDRRHLLKEYCCALHYHKLYSSVKFFLTQPRNLLRTCTLLTQVTCEQVWSMIYLP